MVYYTTKVLVRKSLWKIIIFVYVWVSFMLWNFEKNNIGKKIWFFFWLIFSKKKKKKIGSTLRIRIGQWSKTKQYFFGLTICIPFLIPLTYFAFRWLYCSSIPSSFLSTHGTIAQRWLITKTIHCGGLYSLVWTREKTMQLWTWLFFWLSSFIAPSSR